MRLFRVRKRKMLRVEVGKVIQYMGTIDPEMGTVKLRKLAVKVVRKGGRVRSCMKS